MSDSSQQQFFLEQFQEVRDLLEGGDVKKALGLMLDIRESGFVNKELDSMVDALRDDPPAETVEEARSWADMIVDRIASYGGDVFDLVEEFSEASLGLSEAEWVPVESEAAGDDGSGDDLLEMSFDDFDIDVDIDVEEDDEAGSDFDLDFDDLDAIDDARDLGDFDELGDFGDDNLPSIDFAVVDGGNGGAEDDEPPAEVRREERQTKPNPSVDQNQRETMPHRKAEPEQARDEQETKPHDAVAHNFVAEATRRSEPLADILASDFASRGKSDDDEPASADVQAEVEPSDSSVVEDDDDDFDFDLGFENPASRVETPHQGESPSADSAEEEEEEEDDFDFDLGFTNPAANASEPERLSGGRLEESQDLDFDLSDAQNDGGGTPRLAGADSSDSGGHRDTQETPPSMPSIPRFRSPTDEETSQDDDPGDSLDDDEFFELAESLSGDSSDSQAGPYRGEPLMNTPVPSSSATPMPQPSGIGELSEPSEGRDRNTPNPFAHEAPTGVQQALVDSHSSFVLEEIRESEVSDAKNDDAAVGALMGEARRLYERGRFESAHDLLEAVLDRENPSEEARELMNAVEGELERQYQAKLGALTKVPVLKVSMADIPTMNLDHRFGFLLSQIDGMSTFEDILELSSMTRLETLEVLTQMLDRKIISVS